MATQKRALASPTSPSPFRMRTQSPALSAVRSSPLSSGSLASYPVTASPFGSSPFESSLELSSIDGGPHSPDLFEPLEYTPDLGADFQRMDREAAAITDEHMGTPPSSATQVLVPDTPPPTLLQDQKTWVVFIGKVPGVYDSLCVTLSITMCPYAYTIPQASRQSYRFKDLVAPSSASIPTALLR